MSYPPLSQIPIYSIHTNFKVPPRPPTINCAHRNNRRIPFPISDPQTYCHSFGSFIVPPLTPFSHSFIMPQKPAPGSRASDLPNPVAAHHHEGRSVRRRRTLRSPGPTDHLDAPIGSNPNQQQHMSITIAISSLVLLFRDYFFTVFCRTYLSLPPYRLLLLITHFHFKSHALMHKFGHLC